MLTSEQRRNRRNVRKETRAKVLEWYISVAGIPPQHQVEDSKPYADTVYWWLDPPLPNVVNPVVKECDIQGVWTIEVLPRINPIKSYGGL